LVQVPDFSILWDGEYDMGFQDVLLADIGFNNVESGNIMQAMHIPFFTNSYLL